MSQFSTNEQTSLEKRIQTKHQQKTEFSKICSVYEIQKCVKFIQDNNYKKVCLQFPDYLLTDSVYVVQQLEKELQQKVYVLGDTAYESCCIDFTAAKHINADCIIHFGMVCFSQPETTIPYLLIYEKYDINIDLLTQKIDKKIDQIVVDTPYTHNIAEIILKTEINVIPVNDAASLKGRILYLGKNDRKLFNLFLRNTEIELYFVDPETSKSLDLREYSLDNKILKRRYFLAEKIRDSPTIGIVLSTLAVANYLNILNRTIQLIKLHQKKYYIISVGKPNPAKLANFPEIDVFVVIGCSMNEIYDNRDYYKPVVTVCDLEIALNSNYKQGLFSYDFNHVLFNDLRVDDDDKCDVSLLSGKIRHFSSEDAGAAGDAGTSEVALRSEGQLAPVSFLSSRSWTGLEQDLGKSEVMLAVEGRRGIPTNYSNEL